MLKSDDYKSGDSAFLKPKKLGAKWFLMSENRVKVFRSIWNGRAIGWKTKEQANSCLTILLNQKE